ncbi:MAG: hypothetical protein NC343_04055 [Muribaculum sp.]|nr:hypothetical protein [Muribaculaceae bacterium]MCM1080903.1 hypothetical protein [Muribaculum sp.]
MVTRKVIDELYKRYSKAPKGVEYLDMGALMQHASPEHDLELTDKGELVINSLDPTSPFHTLELRRIHGIVPFERSVALVLPNSILFLNKKDAGVNVHFKPNPTSFIEKLRWWLKRS